MHDAPLVWEGKPSSWLILDTLIIATLLAAGIAAGLYWFNIRWELTYGIPLALWLLMLLPAWLQLKFIHYRLTEKTLYVQQGIRNRETDPIDLFRVLDAVSSEPLLLRLMNCGYVTVFSADVTRPKQRLMGVRFPLKVKDLIRSHAEKERRRHGVREISAQR